MVAVKQFHNGAATTKCDGARNTNGQMIRQVANKPNVRPDHLNHFKTKSEIEILSNNPTLTKNCFTAIARTC